MAHLEGKRRVAEFEERFVETEALTRKEYRRAVKRAKRGDPIDAAFEALRSKYDAMDLSRMSNHSLQQLRVLYHDMAVFRDGEGRPSADLRRRSIMARLYELRDSEPTAVRIVGCDAVNGRVLPFAEALRDPQVPSADCTHRTYSEHPACICVPVPLYEGEKELEEFRRQGLL